MARGTQQGTLADRGEFAGTLGQLQAGCQAGNGMLAGGPRRTELGFPPRGRCKVRRRAERVIRRAKTCRLRVLVITVRSDQSAPSSRQVMRHHLDRQPGAVGGEADGMWFSPTPVAPSFGDEGW